MGHKRRTNDFTYELFDLKRNIYVRMSRKGVRVYGTRRVWSGGAARGHLVDGCPLDYDYIMIN